MWPDTFIMTLFNKKRIFTNTIGFGFGAQTWEGDKSWNAVPLWNNECGIAVRNRNREFRKIKTSHSDLDLNNRKKAQAPVKNL